MRKVDFCLVIGTVQILLAVQGFSQTYNTYSQGANYSGGSYVPPVVTKTYDFNSSYKPQSTNYSSTAPSYNSGSASSSVSSGSTQNGTMTWSQLYSNMKTRRENWKNQAASKEAAYINTGLDLQARQAVQQFELGNYAIAVTELNRYSMMVIDNKLLGKNDERVQSKVNDYFDDFWYYDFLANVKSGHYSDALTKYVLSFSNTLYVNYDPVSDTGLKLLNKLSDPNIFYATGKMEDSLFFGKMSTYDALDQYRLDLGFVETMAALGKKNEALVMYQKIRSFYSKRVNDQPLQKDMGFALLGCGQNSEGVKILNSFIEEQNSAATAYKTLDEVETRVFRWHTVTLDKPLDDFLQMHYRQLGRVYNHADILEYWMVRNSHRKLLCNEKKWVEALAVTNQLDSASSVMGGRSVSQDKIELLKKMGKENESVAAAKIYEAETLKGEEAAFKKALVSANELRAGYLSGKSIESPDSVIAVLYKHGRQALADSVFDLYAQNRIKELTPDPAKEEQIVKSNTNYMNSPSYSKRMYKEAVEREEQMVKMSRKANCRWLMNALSGPVETWAAYNRCDMIDKYLVKEMKLLKKEVDEYSLGVTKAKVLKACGKKL